MEAKIQTGRGRREIEPAACRGGDDPLRAALLEAAKIAEQPLCTALTAQIERQFLWLLGEGHPVRAICRGLGIEPATAYLHRLSDQRFADQWAVAREIRFAHIEDRMGEIAMEGENDAVATVRAGEAVLRATNPDWSAAAGPRKLLGAGLGGPKGYGTIRVKIGQPLVD